MAIRFHGTRLRTLRYHLLPPPTDRDVLSVATRTARRVLAKISAMDDDLDDDETNALSAALMDAVSPPRGPG